MFINNRTQRRMDFLKRKVGTLVTKLRSKKDQTDLPPSLLIKSILESDSEGVLESALHKLAQLSCQQEHYQAIFDQVIGALQSFAYKLKSLRTVAKTLAVATHLLKAGSNSFGQDLRKREGVVVNLQKIDVYRFEGSHPSEKKELEYRLQVIRQRAIFLSKLLHDSQLLDIQRSKMPRNLEALQIQSESMTVNCLIIPVQSSPKNFKVKFTGVSPRPAAQLQERAFDIQQPKSKKSTKL